MSQPPQHPTPMKQRGRARQSAPKCSQRPWAGFTGHDRPRAAPLPVCPSPRCRRVKRCLAALDGLYCLRTHLSRDELVRHDRQTPLAKALAAVPPVADPDNLTERMERIADLARIRRDHEAEMLAQWKAGALDDRHGPYKRSGVLLHPPPCVYEEEGGGAISSASRDRR